MTIILNGRDLEVSAGLYSYEDLVKLAGKSGQPTMVYRAPNRENGSVIPGDTLMLQDGMILSIVDTSSA